jgi:hypothetical protein
MNKEEKKFLIIKSFLKTNYPKIYSEFEEGSYISISSEEYEDSSLWMELDNAGMLTVGLGLAHNHYYPNIDNSNERFNNFITFLTCKKRRTEYYRGNNVIKCEYEYVEENGLLKRYGSVSTLNFVFWKKTTKKVVLQNGFLKKCKVEDLKVKLLNV